jgi:hypothetical protein
MGHLWDVSCNSSSITSRTSMILKRLDEWILAGGGRGIPFEAAPGNTPPPCGCACIAAHGTGNPKRFLPASLGTPG